MILPDFVIYLGLRYRIFRDQSEIRAARVGRNQSARLVDVAVEEIARQGEGIQDVRG